ncbi:hypothetical protein L0Y49_01000 [bacterium]|nr:hypothetical protein [bacterium]
MENKIISGEPDFPITPGHINARGEHLWEAFENVETEVSAVYIVRFCQERSHWGPFTEKEIEEFYVRTSGRKGGFTFNRLIEAGSSFSIRDGMQPAGGGWIVKDKEGNLHVTDDFVWRCYKASPKK